MKKSKLREQIRDLSDQLSQRHSEAIDYKEQIRDLAAQVEQMRANWRPVPIAHPWQPKNPQCALCDEPRDSPRHHVAQWTLNDNPEAARIVAEDGRTP